MTFPNEFLAGLGKVHRLEISKSALINVVASLNEEVSAEGDCYVIGSAADVFALNFDFGPSVIEGTRVSFDDEIGRFLF